MRWFSRRPLALKTERLLLREPAMEDFTQWAAVRGESMDFLTPWEPLWGRDHLSESAYRRRFIKEPPSDVRSFFLIERTGARLVGAVTISNIRYGVAQTASFGYWLGQPHTGKGYMTEALHRLVTYCFEDLYLHRLEAACIPDNQASRNVLERVGFREEGFARQYLKINGHWRDHVLYGLLKEDVGSS